MTDATIDLGELDSRSSPSVTHGWPLWERLRRHQRGMFRLIGGALAAALVFSLAAATPAVSPLKLMFQVHGVDQMTLDRQHLYALTRERLGERATLTAYRLTDGAVHWQTPLPPGQTDLRLSVHGNRILLQNLASRSPRITLVDSDSGELIGTAAGNLVLLTDSALLLERVIDAHDVSELHAVDLATGAGRWRIPWQDAHLPQLEPDATHVVTSDVNGHLTQVYDLATGDLTAAGPAPHTPLSGIYVSGSVALFFHKGNGQLSISAYDLPMLTHRWTVPHPDEEPSPHPPRRCGSAVCLIDRGGQLHALDWATGAYRWSLPLTGQPSPISTAISAFAPPMSPELLLITVPSLGSAWLVDSTTGAPLTDLHGWWFQAPGEIAQPLGFHPPDDTGLLWVGQLRPDGSAIEPLAPMSRGIDGCMSTWPYLVCLGGFAEKDGPHLTVWRVDH